MLEKVQLLKDSVLISFLMVMKLQLGGFTIEKTLI